MHRCHYAYMCSYSYHCSPEKINKAKPEWDSIRTHRNAWKHYYIQSYVFCFIYTNQSCMYMKIYTNTNVTYTYTKFINRIEAFLSNWWMGKQPWFLELFNQSEFSTWNDQYARPLLNRRGTTVSLLKREKCFHLCAWRKIDSTMIFFSYSSFVEWISKNIYTKESVAFFKSNAKQHTLMRQIN